VYDSQAETGFKQAADGDAVKAGVFDQEHALPLEQFRPSRSAGVTAKPHVRPTPCNSPLGPKIDAARAAATG
jgi:hypothetical protein